MTESSIFVVSRHTKKINPPFLLLQTKERVKKTNKSKILALSDCSLNKYKRNIENISMTL